MSLPGLAELLRPAAPEDLALSSDPVQLTRQASGRESHPHKITVYLSAQELADLERARLVLRGYGVTVDRGRLVREAIAVLLADLALQGEASVVTRRLTGAAAAGPAERQ